MEGGHVGSQAPLNLKFFLCVPLLPPRNPDYASAMGNTNVLEMNFKKQCQGKDDFMKDFDKSS